MKITIEKGDEHYRLIGPNGEEGDLTEYGEPATLELDGTLYMALLPDAEEEYEELASKVYALEECETEITEVDFQEQPEEAEAG